MAFRKSKMKEEINLNIVPMIDITSFILLSLAILSMSMKKEASLDNILKLPPIPHASKQDKTLLQIYVLPAVVKSGGNVDPDSTGLVAFEGKSAIPKECPNCKLAFRNEKGSYVPNSLLSIAGVPVATIQSMKEKQDIDEKKLKRELPAAYFCSKCRYEISPYLKLDEIPQALKAKKKEILDLMVSTENFSRSRLQKSPMSTEEVKKMEDDIPLMVKADDKAFFGRILRVVAMAEDTLCRVRKFAFVTLAEASLEAQKKKAAQEKGKIFSDENKD